jgi:hypothetical protein
LFEPIAKIEPFTDNNVNVFGVGMQNGTELLKIDTFQLGWQRLRIFSEITQAGV